MQPSPDLTLHLRVTDLVLAIFEETQPTSAAASAAVTRYAHLTSAEPAEPQQIAPQLLADLALWADARASSGRRLLEQIRDNWTQPDLGPTNGPAGQLTAHLASLAQEHHITVLWLFHKASDLYDQAVARERDHRRQLANSGQLDPATPVRYHLTVPDGYDDNHPGGITGFPTATAAWLHFLRHDTPDSPARITADTAGDGELRVLRPADLHQDALAEAAKQDAWIDLRYHLQREAETAWLRHRMTQTARYLPYTTGVRLRVRNRWTSAVLEATVRLEYGGILTRIENLDGVEVDESLPGTVAAAVAAVRRLPERLDWVDDGELVSLWRVLEPFASRAPQDGPELAAAVERILDELTARDIGAQRLRAVLEPLQADAWLEAVRPGPFGDHRPGLDAWRQRQVALAHDQARAYTRARLLEGDADGRSEAGHIGIRRRALETAGIIAAADIGTGAEPGPPPESPDQSLDYYQITWTQFHPAAGEALTAEVGAWRTAAWVFTESTSLRDGAQAAYWRLRADRTAAAYGVLARLTQPRSTEPPGPYGATMRELENVSCRSMVRAVFGSEQRAADMMGASAAYLEGLHAATSDMLASHHSGWSEEQIADARRNNEQRRRQASALRDAGQELVRLFPHLQQPGPGAVADPARIQQVTAAYTSGASLRRGIAHRSHRPPASAHDPAQHSAHTAQFPGPGGPAPA